MNAQNAVTTSAMVTLGSTTAYHLLPAAYGGKSELPPFRLLVGTALTYTGLSIMADLAPQVATGLSAAIGLTALIYYGVPIADRYFNNGQSNLPIGVPHAS